jgi:hypothetical protein
MMDKKSYVVGYADALDTELVFVQDKAYYDVQLPDGKHLAWLTEDEYRWVKERVKTNGPV